MELHLRPLPDCAKAICQAVNAPPRLVAHLTLVHDVACQLVEEIQTAWPDLDFDGESVLLGASLHDIGKALHPNELVAHGKAHEVAGEQLLIMLGVAPHLARFARTHAAWRVDSSLMLEDLFVALADTCWKGARVSELEDLTAERIAILAKQEGWEIFFKLDNLLETLAADADQRLAWQVQFPVA